MVGSFFDFQGLVVGLSKGGPLGWPRFWEPLGWPIFWEKNHYDSLRVRLLVEFLGGFWKDEFSKEALGQLLEGSGGLGGFEGDLG